jgi:ankyrin repeat protein
MKNQFIIPSIIIAAAILGGFWMLKPPPKAPDISIHKAAEEGNIEAVKQHLATGTYVDRKNQDEKSPLFYAAKFGHKEIVELLIAKGADVNPKDDDGYTLKNAASEGHKEIVELLIANGADVNAYPKGGSTPLMNAANKEIAELLIDNGADVNAVISFGWTPLHLVDDLEIARLLISKGANVNAGFKTGETPFDSATSKGRWDIADLLRKHGGTMHESTPGVLDQLLEAEGK